MSVRLVERGAVRRGLVLLLLAAVAGLWWLVFQYPKQQRHKAAVAYCGAKAFDAFEASFREKISAYHRASEAAGVAPRIALAPLVLRVSEAMDAMRQVQGPPCAKPVLEATLAGMELQLHALKQFAMNAPGEGREAAVAGESKLELALTALNDARRSRVVD